MKRITSLSLVLMIIVSACTLASDNDTGSEAESTITVNAPVVTEEVVQSTNTPQPTLVPQATTDTTNNTDGVISDDACTPQTTGVIYTVASGDTLSSIASRVNSTVNQLATANCLDDVNALVIGQQLYVPRLPVVVPTATSEPTIQQGGGATITQMLAGDAGHVAVLTDATATLSWFEPPNMPTATMVQFVLVPNFDQFSGGTVIATDTDLTDGISATWVVTPNARGFLMAFAYRDEVTLVAQSEFPSSVSSGPGSGERCVITLNVDLNYYDEPFAETAVGSYTAGTQFEQLGRHLSGWYAVHPDNSGAVGVEGLFWLPVDADMTKSGENC